MHLIIIQTFSNFFQSLEHCIGDFLDNCDENDDHDISFQGTNLLRGIVKEIGDEEPCYSTKISIFSFIWAGLAALHKATII